MRAKPDMKPWVNRGHTIKSSVGAALQREHLPYVLEVPPLWGSINVFITTNPGLVPWAMQECRPCRAHLRYHQQSVTCLF